MSEGETVKLGFSIHRVEADARGPQGVQKLPFRMVQGEITCGDGWEIERVRFENPDGTPYEGIRRIDDKLAPVEHDMLDPGTIAPVLTAGIVELDP